MKWFYRSLLFFGVALLFAAGVLGLNQLGALSRFEMTGRYGGPPTQIQSLSGTAPASDRATNAGSANTSSSSRGPATLSGAPVGRPRGEGGGSFQWAEVGKDLAFVALAWLALSGLDWLASRRADTPAESNQRRRP